MATALDRGWEVVGLCRPAPGERPLELPGVEVIRVGHERVGGALRRAGLGGMRRANPVERELRGLYRLGRLGRTTAAFVAAGRRAGKLDVVHANDLGTLPAGYLLAPLGGTRLLAQGRAVLWLACAGLCAAAALGQLALRPAIRRREELTLTGRQGVPAR